MHLGSTGMPAIGCTLHSHGAPPACMRWAMRYDAIRIQFSNIRGILRSGRLAEVVPVGSTIAVDLAVRAGTTRVVLIDLYVEDRGDHYPGQYAVKIRAVQVQGH